MTQTITNQDTSTTNEDTVGIRHEVSSEDNIAIDSTIIKLNITDSIIVASQENIIVETTCSTEELLPIDRRIENTNNTPWLSSTLIIVLLLTLYLIGKHKKSYIFAIRNIISSKNRSISYDEENTNTGVSSIVLWGITLLSFTLFMIINVLPHESSVEVLRNPKIIGIYVGLITGFSILKYLGFKLTAYIFDSRKNMQIYIDSYFTIVGTLGILLIPINISTIYSPAILQEIMVVTGLITIAISFIFMVYKSIQIFFSNIGSLLYIFLYLCALEILPILVLIKTVFLLR